MFLQRSDVVGSATVKSPAPRIHRRTLSFNDRNYSLD